MKSFKKIIDKYKILIISIFLFFLILIYFFIDPQIQLMPKCPFYLLTGFYCPGCGSQRSLHEIFNFHFVEAISFNIVMVATIPFVIIELFLKIFKFKSFLSYKYSAIIVLTIILLFFILRNLPFEPFKYLTP